MVAGMLVRPLAAWVSRQTERDVGRVQVLYKKAPS